MKYFRIFGNKSEYDDFMGTLRTTPNVSLIEDVNEVIFNEESVDIDLPLYFDIIEGGTLTFSAST